MTSANHSFVDPIIIIPESNARSLLLKLLQKSYAISLTLIGARLYNQCFEMRVVSILRLVESSVVRESIDEVVMATIIVLLNLFLIFCFLNGGGTLGLTISCSDNRFIIILFRIILLVNNYPSLTPL